METAFTALIWVITGVVSLFGLTLLAVAIGSIFRGDD